MRESAREIAPAGAAGPASSAAMPPEEVLMAAAAAAAAAASSAASTASSSSSGRAGRQHSTMPTYTPQHPRVPPPPLSVRHSASLDLQRKEKVVSERLTPRQFLDKYSLPRVVRVVSELPGASAGPLSGPLLLYRHYNSTKVQAHSVASPKEVATVGPALVVPDCYQGWFSLVTAKGQLTAQCYCSLEQLVANNVASFLTNTEVAAYKLNEGKDALHKDAGLTRRRLQYAKTSIGAGQLVRLVAVFEDVHQPAAASSASQRAQRRLSLTSVGRGKKYAQCVNHKNQAVFIPLNTAGQFYAVSCGPDEPDDLRMLYQVPQLLTDYRLPLKVHLVSGPLPSPRPSGFTGTLLLEQYQEEDVILACTLPQDLTTRASGSVQPQLLEMDADSRFLLSRPLFHQESESRLFKSQVLQAALCFCRDRGDIWRRQIKVTHHIFPPSSQHQQQQQPKKAPRDRSKSRTITKKSSSFMYTSKPRSEVPAISGPPCELLGVIAYGSADARVASGASVELHRPIDVRVMSMGSNELHHPGDVRNISGVGVELHHPSDVRIISGAGKELRRPGNVRVISGASVELHRSGDGRAISLLTSQQPVTPRHELERALSDPRTTSVSTRELLGRALSDEQLLRTQRSRQQQEKLRQHSSVISALTRQLRQARLVASVADIQNRDLPAILKVPGEEIPYSRVADAVCSPLDHEGENIYAEICDSPSTNTNSSGSSSNINHNHNHNHSHHTNKHKFKYLCLRSKNNVDTPTDDFYYVQLEGGNEAAYLNAIARLDSLTHEEEPAYDTVC